MDRSLLHLNGIKYLNHKISISPLLFNYVGLCGQHQNYVLVKNSIKFSFEIKFMFGHKNILALILSSISYLNLNNVNYLFLADLIQSYYQIDRQLYEGNLKGNGLISFGIEDLFDFNKKISKWSFAHKFGDNRLEINLSLKNSFSNRKYQCILISNDNSNNNNNNNEGTTNININKNIMRWKIDEFIDFNSTDWPLLLSVYSPNMWTPQFISNIFMTLIKECVFNKIEEKIYNLYKNKTNVVYNFSNLWSSSFNKPLNGSITILKEAWNNFYIDLDNIKPYITQWMTHLFTEECVYDYSDD